MKSIKKALKTLRNFGVISLLTFDGKNILIKYKDNQIVYKKELTFKYNKASMSPNGKYLLFYNNDNSIFIMDTDTFTKTKLALPETTVYSVVWSDNSTKLAVVQGHEKLQDTDLISLFVLKWTNAQQRVLRNRGDGKKTQLYIAIQIQLGRDVY